MSTQLRAVLPAPMAMPPRYGLIAAAQTVEDTENRWEGGFQFAPEQCGGGGTFTVDCDGGTDALDTFQNPGFVTGEAFGVYAGDKCSAFGFEARDYVGRAQRQLAATESFLIADELWTGTLTPAQAHLTDAASDTLTDGGPTDEVSALGMVEYGLGRHGKGRRGMVHVTTQMLTHMVTNGSVYRDGSVWLTAMGNIVVADAGYDGSGPGGVPAGASQWIYGTSMITVRLSPVEVLPGEFAQAMNHSLNDVTYVAQRLAAYVWDDCVHVAAEVSIPAPKLDGVS